MWTEQQERRIREQIRIQENLYNDFLEDYRSVSEQLGYAMNAEDKNKLSRQLKALQKDIESVELESLRLENKLRDLVVSEEWSSGRGSSIGEVEPVSPKASFDSILQFFFAWPLKSPRPLIITIVLVMVWSWLAHSGQVVSIMDGREDILNRNSLYGFYGGILSGSLLFFAYYSKGFYRDLSFKINSIVFFIYCLSSGLLSGSCWYLIERIITSSMNESVFGHGANWSSIICTIVSLAFLYWPAKRSEKLLRRK